MAQEQLFADDYKVNLDVFEGPLDLLLYLIRREELDIYDIPIEHVTAEYMRFIEDARRLNLDIAGEFNKWNPTAKKMAFKAGVYSAKLKLAPGNYQYKFVIDGTWCADPENANAVPNDQGTYNSVITVK